MRDEDRQVLKELTAIKKLLMMQLSATGVSRTAIGKALGITQASELRRQIPKVRPSSLKKGNKE